MEVRSRYLEWTDGRLAQLVVATDITARRLAEARSAEHEQRAQAASRLVTMGEMASSVAHELNQPLTAIHNYCSGMRDRIASGSMQQQDLLQALENRPPGATPGRSFNASAPSSSAAPPTTCEPRCARWWKTPWSWPKSKCAAARCA